MADLLVPRRRVAHWGIRPGRAPVTPRVELMDVVGGGVFGDPISIELRFADLLARHRRGGMVCLCGGAGSGKSVAMEHLAASLPDDAGVVLRDDNVLLAHHHALNDGSLVVCTVREPVTPLPESLVAVVRMAPWTRDDVIEYVLGAAGARAREVLNRVLGCDSVGRMEGSPELWRVVLDEMIADAELLDVRGALLGWLRRNVPAWEAACSASLDVLCAASDDKRMKNAGGALARQPVLRQRYAQLLLASQKLASELAEIESSELLEAPLPAELLAEAGKLARARAGAVEHLRMVLGGPESERHAAAATILLSAEPGWRPENGTTACLKGARLGAVRWSHLLMPRAQLAGAELCGADLSLADLRQAALTGANVSWANLRRATLSGVLAKGANLSGADLTRAQAAGAMLAGCDLSRATLDSANLVGAELESAVLVGASLVGVNLLDAQMRGVDLRGAVLSGANLSRANLAGVKLAAAASLEGAHFARANLEGCDLEGVEMERPEFTGAVLREALLTGSTMRRGRFRGANLSYAGLADVDWGDADLSGADLRGASFHLGTTRCGMVGSDVPCEGSRTGFYTDEYSEREYRAPEEIRKANLCGADLRGAIIDGVDFYLVDLRGARYTAEQREHFVRCGAILRDSG